MPRISAQPSLGSWPLVIGQSWHARRAQHLLLGLLPLRLSRKNHDHDQTVQYPAHIQQTPVALLQHRTWRFRRARITSKRKGRRTSSTSLCELWQVRARLSPVACSWSHGSRERSRGVTRPMNHEGEISLVSTRIISG